ncbi:MAG: carbohydrate kinase, partial [Lachnospiraceae bacterium]|nr:carbohydrate kinase [Lachnospiraceae bacterium]
WKSHMYFEEGAKNYTAEAMSFASASAYRWFRDVICTKEMADGEAEGKDPYEIINEEIAASVPGAHGVTFLPYLQGKANTHRGETGSPLTATFTGMTMATVRSDMCRAVAEGILYEMRDIVSIVKEHGMEVGDIRVTGGVTQSPTWCQMAADIFQIPITITETSENGCLGAAIFAGIGAGIYKDAKEGAEKAVRIKCVYEPNPEMKEAYDAGFERFVSIYKKLERID